MFKKTLSLLSLMLLFSYAFSHDADVVSSFSFSHGPYIQDVSKSGATIVFTTSQPSFSWVELTDDNGITQAFYNIEHGVKMANITFHTIRIDKLSPAKEYAYRLFSKEITKFDPYSVVYGDSITSASFSFSTLNPAADMVTFIEMSDIHGKNDKLERLLFHADVKSADMVIYAGDMMDYYATEDQPFHNFIDKSVEVFASETPFWLVRGNHETRGRYSRNLFRYVPREDGRYYYTVKQGPVLFIFLDSGEDKPDDHHVYAGLNDFDNYREEQAAWLRQVVASDEYKKASYRIVVTHIPPLADGWHSELHITKTWLPILNEASIDLMLAGHLHELKYFTKDADIYAFPLIIGSNNSAARVVVNGDGIKVKTIDVDGNVIDEMNL
jgi:predicted phosphodiesterase